MHDAHETAAAADTAVMSPSSPAPSPRADVPRPGARAATWPVLLGTALIVLAALAGAAALARTPRARRAEADTRLASGVERAQAAVRAWEAQALARATSRAEDAQLTGAGVEPGPALAALVRSASSEGVRAAVLYSPEGMLLASSAGSAAAAWAGARPEAVRRAAEGRAAVSGPHRPADGRGEWMVAVAAPVRDAQGRPRAVLALLHGLEAPLRPTQLAVRGDAGALLWLVTREGEVLAQGAEPVAGRVVGAPPRVARPWTDGASGIVRRAYAAADGRRVVSAWGAAAPLEARLLYEVPAATLAGGGAIPLEGALALALAMAAALAAWQGVTLARACRGARTEEAEAVAVVNSSPNAVLVCDAEGRVTRVNARAAALLEALPAQLLGSTLDQWLEAGVPWRPERLTSWLDAAAREGAARRGDGTTVPVDVRVGHGEFAGGALHVVVLLDRTAQRGAARAAQEAREEAAKARARQEELVQVMHQEIRTPMSRVMGMAHLLHDTSLTPVQQGYVDSLMRSAQLMMTFVTDVLDLAKIEQGTLQLIEAPFEVRPMLQEVGALCAPQAEQSRTILETRVTERTPAWLVGDAGRLRQVLINLVGNGIRFAPGGQVEVKLDGEPLAGEATLHVRVRDNGPGMDNETIRRLFAKDPTTVSKLAGGGLGISMAKHLVELMGGKLEVRSLQGEGSTFHFRLRLRMTEQASGASVSTTAKLAGARALVVDRSPQETAVTREWLRSWGMRVETTATPEEAIGHLRRAAAEGDPVEVALVDRQSVGEQADAFARRLRGEPAIAGTGLLISTAGPTGAEAEKLAAAGCDALISKPFGAQALSRTLAAVVERPRAERGRGALIRAEALTAAARAPQERPDGHIPILEEPSAPRRALPEPLEDTRLRVLLAEDNRVNQIVATNLLQRLGCRVEVVGDGAEAVRLASRQEFDVILMDIQMPMLDGLGATGLIRRLAPPLNGPHIIAMGTSASPDEHDRYLAAGMNDVVVKPLTPEAVQSALERRPAGLERVSR